MTELSPVCTYEGDHRQKDGVGKWNHITCASLRPRLIHRQVFPCLRLKKKEKKKVFLHLSLQV